MEMAVKYISHSFVARVNFAMVTKKWGFSGAHFFNVILHCSLECKARQRNVCVCLLFFHSADTRSRSMGKDERPWTSRSKPRLEEIFKVKPRTYLSAGRAGSEVSYSRWDGWHGESLLVFQCLCRRSGGTEGRLVFESDSKIQKISTQFGKKVFTQYN